MSEDQDARSQTTDGDEDTWRRSGSLGCCGDNVVRLAFLDESGRSRQEPVMVVAGVIVHGDRVYRQLEARLRGIVAALVPEADRETVILHATDLFQGNGYFARSKWPKQRRHEILTELALLPAEFGLPVVYGYAVKADYRASAGIREVLTPVGIHEKRVVFAAKGLDHAIDVGEHLTAFVQAEIAVERQMRQYPRDEACMLIAEDTDRVKKAIKQAHAFLRSPRAKGLADDSDDVLPLQRVIDTPHFAEKSDSLPLQVADVCAYLIMRRFLRREDTQTFFEKIAPQLFWWATGFGEQMGSEKSEGGRFY